jgi:hypothetical protein
MNRIKMFIKDCWIEDEGADWVTRSAFCFMVIAIFAVLISIGCDIYLLFHL